MDSNTDVTTIPPGPALRNPMLLGFLCLAFAAGLLWMTAELADPNFQGRRRTDLLELLPVWLRVPPFLMVAILAFLGARSYFKIAQAGWALVLSPAGLAMPGGFGWKTFDWSEFSSAAIGGSKPDSIRLRFARRDLVAKLRRRRFSELELLQAHYGMPTSEILTIIERYRSQTRPT